MNSCEHIQTHTVYTDTYIHIRSYLQTYSDTYRHIQTHTDTYRHIQTHTIIHTDTYKLTHIIIHKDLRKHKYTYTLFHRHTHANTNSPHPRWHTYISTHKNIYILFPVGIILTAVYRPIHPPPFLPPLHEALGPPLVQDQTRGVKENTGNRYRLPKQPVVCV